MFGGILKCKNDMTCDEVGVLLGHLITVLSVLIARELENRSFTSVSCEVSTTSNSRHAPLAG